MSEHRLDIYTDGSCGGNPGPGGWAAIMVFGSEEKVLSGGERETTNNRMELMAAIAALEAVKRDVPIRLTTDSRYVQDGMEQWLVKWKQNGWKTANRKPVKNADLWQRLDQAAASLTIEWCWVKAHDGHQYNERVDTLARTAMAAHL